VADKKNPNSRVTPFGRELRFATVAYLAEGAHERSE